MNFIFPYIGNVIIPTDELIFFRGVGQPPTRYMQHDSIMVVSFRVWFQRWHLHPEKFRPKIDQRTAVIKRT